MRAKYGGPPSQFVAIADGVTVHLRDEGPKGAPAIMLLHGSNADLHTWEPWVQALRQDYRVIRFDQVGHGLTGPDPAHDYSRANYVADIAEVADALGLDTFILGGNSMGGKHALAFAVAHPERIAGLVLVDGSGGPMLDRDEDKAEPEEEGQFQRQYRLQDCPDAGHQSAGRTDHPAQSDRPEPRTERFGQIGGERGGG